MVRERDGAKAKKKQEREVQLQQALLACVLEALRRFAAARRKVLYKKWGVHELPPGIEQGTLHAPADCLRAVLFLSDASVRPGPLRQTLGEACADLRELSALQLKGGDGAACRELERRDVDAMTVFFQDELMRG